MKISYQRLKTTQVIILYPVETQYYRDIKHILSEKINILSGIMQ